MKKIWIIYNGNYITNAVLWHIDRFAASIERYGYRAERFATTEIATVLTDGATVWGAEEPPEKILFWDKDVLLAQTLEEQGARLYNNSVCIARCDNKAVCYRELVKHGVPIVKTVLPPKVYYTARDEEIYKKIGAMLGYPLVVKENYGSFGTGVYRAESEPQMLDLVRKLGNTEYLFQEYLAAACGEDIRVIVVGGTVVTAVKRINTEDFRANVARGGKMVPYMLSAEEEDIAVRAAAAMRADFCGVDLLHGADGEVYVCEVNSNMHFKACEEVSGADVAGSIAAQICAEQA